MISLPFKKKFDFVYATFDSINYLLTQKELQFLFKEIEIFLLFEIFAHFACFAANWFFTGFCKM